MRILYTIFITIITGIISNAQVLISDETNTPTTISSNAILELRTLSKSKGILLPKVSLTATNNSSPLPSHLTGMMVYNIASTNNSDVNTNVFPGIYYNDGTSWAKMDANIPSIGDIKYSNITTDHDGWYLLNGRLVSSLPTTALNNANAISIGASLPNTEDTFLKGKTGAETVGTIVGNNTNTLTVSNLPNTSYSGTTSLNGSHTHNYGDRGQGRIQSIESAILGIVDDWGATNPITSSAGDHSHTFTVNIGGSNTPIDVRPQYLTTNIFIYLGK